MQYNSNLVMSNLVFRKLHLSVFPPLAMDQHSLIPSFSRFIDKIDDKSFSISLQAKISDSSRNQLTIEIDLFAEFKLTNWEKPENEQIVRANTVAILFPYLRSALTSLTSVANIGALVLPIISVDQLFPE